MILTKILIIISILPHTFQWLPKIVWTFWNQPLSTSHLLSAFHNNHIHFTQGWQLRHLDNENMWKWLDPIPKFRQIYESQVWKNQIIAKKSDIIRLSLLNFYGGVYFDLTVILTQNLDWILDVRNQRQFFNDGEQPDIFINYSFFSKGQYYQHPTTNIKTPIIPSFQVFILASKPKTKFFTEWLSLLFKLKKQSYQKYGLQKQKSVIVDKAAIDNIPTSFALNSNYFQIQICGIWNLYNKQKQLQGDIFTQPLAIRYYKIWLMNTYDSAYRNEVGVGKKYYFENYLSKMDIKVLKQQNTFPPYFLKFMSINYYNVRQETIKFRICDQGNYALKNSIINQYLFKYYSSKVFNKIIVDQESQDSGVCWWIVYIFIGVLVIYVGSIGFASYMGQVFERNQKLLIDNKEEIRDQINQQSCLKTKEMIK